VHIVKFADFSSQYLASCGDTIVFWDIGEEAATNNEQSKRDELILSDSQHSDN
jgi:hypothetical protein